MQNVHDSSRRVASPATVAVRQTGIPDPLAPVLAEILDGLQEGEEVVTVGTQELRDNDRVAVNQSAPWNK